MTTKPCTKCGIEKLLEEFSKKTKNRLNSRCKICVREFTREHYLKNKDYYIDKAIKHNKKYKLINQKFIWDFLKTHPCVDCGESDPIVLEFDHIKDKANNISNMISQSYSLDTIKEEIEKCEVRCANCHRRKTSKQFNWYKDVI